MKNKSSSHKKHECFNKAFMLFPYIASRIADIKGMDVVEVKRVTTDNAKQLFDIN